MSKDAAKLTKAIKPEVAEEIKKIDEVKTSVVTHDVLKALEAHIKVCIDSLKHDLTRLELVKRLTSCQHLISESLKK